MAKKRKIEKPEDKKKRLIHDNLHSGESINLAVKMTKEEVVVESKKTKFNYGGALSVLLFVLMFVVVMLINVYYKMILVEEKEKLYNDYELRVMNQYDKIILIDDISTRTRIYNEKGGSKVEYYSSLDYWDKVSENIAEVRSIGITGEYRFEIGGEADTFIQGAVMWNYMSSHESIDTANLKSISKRGEGAAFQFDGLLSEKYFIDKKSTQGLTGAL